MKTITYTLPAYWASYLINGDASGLEDSDEEQIRAFMASHRDIGSCMDCSEESWFSHRNDANALGGDVCEFTFTDYQDFDARR